MLGINPFDQPDVQAAKDRTNEVLASGDVALEPEGSLDALLRGGRAARLRLHPGIRRPERAECGAGSRRTRARWRERDGMRVTHGFGPRYLHSTGQLHKGGPDTGIFLQVVEDYGAELPIPGKPFGFGRLIRAQAAGDFESLRERGRRIARVRLEEV